MLFWSDIFVLAFPKMKRSFLNKFKGCIFNRHLFMEVTRCDNRCVAILWFLKGNNVPTKDIISLCINVHAGDFGWW